MPPLSLLTRRGFRPGAARRLTRAAAGRASGLSERDPARYTRGMSDRFAWFLLLCAWALAQPAAAQSRDERLTRQLLQGLSEEGRSQPSLSASEAARRAQAEHGGQVLAVDSAHRGYRVKLLVNGEVRIVTVDR
jgi:hypothetical protein